MNTTLEIDAFTSPTDTSAEDFQTAVGLLTAYTQVTQELGGHQRHADSVLLALAESCRVEYASLQERQCALEEQLETLVRRHPEWFTKRKSLVTPSGTIKLTATSKLEPVNEQLSVELVRRHFEASSGLYLRVEETLNLEALEALSDRVLRKMKIKRVRGESFSVAPIKAPLGKAISKAKEGAK